MPDLFVELFSEEIPARLQARGAEDMARLATEALAPLSPACVETFHGPRRLALAMTVHAQVASSRTQERGPRTSAPEQALAGFLRKHGASREALREEGDFWVLEKTSPAMPAATLIADALPRLLRRFPWPKSMRWGGTSAFTWIRPLRRIVCLLDGQVVGFTLQDGADDGHGLAAGCETEGHRGRGPHSIAVAGVQDWRDKLLAHQVMVEGRAEAIRHGLARLAAEQGISVVEDAGLLEEVAGLVEWPVPLLGRIDAGYMDLPPEVMQVSMRVNQRYFATRTPNGQPAPWFAFAANLEAPDGGAAIVAGNERVLRARFSDARHFWDLDRRTRLADRVAGLDNVTFHAALGSQGDRVRRLVRLAGAVAPLVGADQALAERAALLSKADLTTGMVGEFPELQGVMGGYYAAHDGESAMVSDAVRAHYAPRGAGDDVPGEPVAVSVALADKIDQLVGFFAIGERPTGSGDPYALRRAALGVIRIIRENRLRMSLREVVSVSAREFATDRAELAASVLAFVVERLRVQLRSEGARHDVLAAVFNAADEDDLGRALARTGAITSFLATEDGANLLSAYKRASNILRIEDRRDGPHDGPVQEPLLSAEPEQTLYRTLQDARALDEMLHGERFADAMTMLAAWRPALDDFFDKVTVNDNQDAVRRNRLRLLNTLRNSLDRVADFSQIDS